MNGAETLVHTLLDGGVDVCFANPGTSEMHFVAALDKIAGMRCVLGLFEGVVTGAADGYYRIADRPAATLLHLGPGLANGLANLHNARKAGSGIVNVVGDHASAHLQLDAPLTSDIATLARPMSHWVHSTASASTVAEDARQAMRQANMRPGRIATLILPADAAWSEAAHEVAPGASLAWSGALNAPIEQPYSTNAPVQQPRAPDASLDWPYSPNVAVEQSSVAPNAPVERAQAQAGLGQTQPAAAVPLALPQAPEWMADPLAAAAMALRRGPSTLLLLGGRALRADATRWAGRVAAATGCALMSEFYGARIERGAGRVIVPRLPYAVDPSLAALAPFDRIVLVGAKPPVAFFAYPGKPGKLSRADCQCIELATPEHDLEQALRALCEALGAGAHGGAGPGRIAERIGSAARAAALAGSGLAGAALHGSRPAGAALHGSRPAGAALHGSRPAGAALPDGALDAAGIGRVLAALIPDNAIVVDEAVSTGRGFDGATVGAAPHDWLTGCGGSIGFALPVAVGAAIAAPDRKVLALEGDGSGMYTLQSLWTMVREGLNITVLIFANRSYQILRGEFSQVGAGVPGQRATDMLSLERPTLDWVALARGMGMQASRASDLASLGKQLQQALAADGPCLVEVIL